MKILALDLGIRKSVACVYETEEAGGRFVTVATTVESMEKLLEETGPDRVVMEVGPITGWVYDVAVRSGAQEVQVAGTGGEAWKWKNVKKKTDREDALKLAQLSAMGQIAPVHMPSSATRQWRMLMEYRGRLVGARTAIRNRIRAVLRSQALDLPAGRKGWSGASREALQELASSLEVVGPEELWRGLLDQELRRLDDVQERLEAVTGKLDEIGQADHRVQLVQTIPGVGPRLAECIVSTIDDPHRFRSGRQVSSYAGLTPRQFQSGQMNRQGRITKRGRASLRKLLVEASWLALRFNPWLRETYHRIQGNSRQRKKIAIVAAARRLLVAAWAMLRDNQPWRPPDAMVPPEEESPKVSPRRGMEQFLAAGPKVA